MIPAPTPAQRAALRADASAHADWLRRKEVTAVDWPMAEAPYTGLLLAALLDPDASRTVVRALFAGADASTRRTMARTRPRAVEAPTRGVDLVIALGPPGRTHLLFLEHKRFASHSHAPGYRTREDAPWQTDQAYHAATAGTSRYGHVDADRLHFLVLDGYGKTMDQLFPGGEFNDQWQVTSYPQFAATLRADHEGGVRGLVPLLAALYARGG